MALPKAIVGSDHRAIQITFTDDDGTAIDLTSATITGKIKPIGGSAAAITGSLDLSDATNGVFTWTYSAADIDTAGEYDVQFIATYNNGTKQKCYIERFVIEEALDE